MKNYKKLLVLSLVCFLVTAFAGVSFGATKINLAGSTSVQPLVEELAKAYEAKHGDVKIFVQGGGSGAGVKATMAGTASIGMCSRELKSSEKSLKQTVIAKDGIVIVVHPSNAVKNLTLTQVKDIFAGKITNWKQVGGKNKKITIVTRESGSGTRGAFEEIVMGKSKITTKALTQNSTGAVHQTVALDPTTIGYISLGNLDSKVKGLSINGVKPTIKTVKNGTYKISRPFLFLTKSTPKGEVAKFILWVTGGEGQKIVAKDFISVNR